MLRAETTLDTRPDLSLHDLDQALQLQAGNARARWARCRVLASFGEYSKAMVDGAEAIRLEPQDGHYRVTQAEVLARAGSLKEAAAAAEKAVELSEDRPHVKALALCLLGDISPRAPRPITARPSSTIRRRCKRPSRWRSASTRRSAWPPRK